MADSTPAIDLISQSQSQKEVTANGNFTALSPAALFGRRPQSSVGLTWGYYGGRINGTAVASGTVSLTASNTNYVVVHRGTLAVSVSTSSTNWNDNTTYGRAYKVTTDASSATSWEDHRLGTGGLLTPSVPCVIQVAASDETTALTTGAGKLTFRMPHAMTLTEVRASLTTASSSGAPQVDINQGGASVLSTPLTIDQGEKTSTTAATPAVISTASLTDDAEITIDIDTAGTNAAGLKVTLIGKRLPA